MRVFLLSAREMPDDWTLAVGVLPSSLAIGLDFGRPPIAIPDAAYDALIEALRPDEEDAYEEATS